MAYRKKTLRVMSPTARKVARLIGELESVSRRLKNLVPDFQTLDFNARALQGAKSGLILSDSDAWGLQSAIVHGQQTGCFDENKEWAEAMHQRIIKYREEQS